MEKIGVQAVLDSAAFLDGLAEYVTALNSATDTTEQDAYMNDQALQEMTNRGGASLSELAESFQNTTHAVAMLADAGGAHIDVFREIVVGALREVGAAMLHFAHDTGAAAVDVLRDGVVAAADSERVMTRLASVVRSTGGAAGMTVDELVRLAESYGRLTASNAELVMEIEEMGLRMGTVTKETMPDFIQASLDLAAATGTDAANAAYLLATAYDDPEAAMMRFNRQGIRFNTVLETQIKQLMKAGKNSEALALVLDRVKTATAGSADAAANTAAGKWEYFVGRLRDAQKAVGFGLLPVLTKLLDMVLMHLLPYIDDIAATFTKLVEALDVGDRLSSISSALAQMLKLLSKGEIAPAFVALLSNPDMAGLSEVFGLSTSRLIDFGARLQKLSSQAAPEFERLGTTAWDTLDRITTQWQAAMPGLLAQVGDTLAAMTAFWAEHGDTISQIMSVAGQLISTTLLVTLQIVLATVEIFFNILDTIFLAAEQALVGDWNSCWKTLLVGAVEVFYQLVDLAQTIMNTILSTVGMDLQSFLDAWSGTFNLIGIFLATWWQQTRDSIAAWLMDITSGIQDWLIDMANNWRDNFAEIQRIVSEKIERIKQVITGIKDAFSGAIAGVMDFAGALSRLAPPPLFTPGSPTPFELGLRGITASLEAMHTAAAQALPATLASAAMAPVPVVSQHTVQQAVNIGAVTLASGMDMATFEAMLTRALMRAR